MAEDGALSPGACAFGERGSGQRSQAGAASICELNNFLQNPESILRAYLGWLGSAIFKIF